MPLRQRSGSIASAKQLDAKEQEKEFIQLLHIAWHSAHERVPDNDCHCLVVIGSLANAGFRKRKGKGYKLQRAFELEHCWLCRVWVVQHAPPSHSDHYVEGW